MQETRIFISYRREDTAPYAGRIYDRLVTEFGSEQVFFDIDTILAGDDFVEVLTQKVESCDVLLAVIGKSWLTIADAAGRARIHNPEDFVVIEIGAALRRKVRVIPILVGGGHMPLSSELPSELALLARRQAHELPDKGFVPALEKLFPVLRKPMSVAAAAGSGTTGTAPIQSATLQAGTTKVNPKDGLTYIWIPPGNFTMGCSPGDTQCRGQEKPAHRVEITKGFWIGETPVTEEAYQHVTGSNPSKFKGPQRPVENVSWEDAHRYCQAVGMRLPTEAQWEYAARAGSTSAQNGKLDEIAWYAQNSNNQTHDVKGKQANHWGLYDTLGNVWEWTADWFDETYYARSEVRDPAGPKEGTYRVVRGGSWSGLPQSVRASDRVRNEPTVRDNDIGFRCVGELS
jgi:formylglycine-generating enzyme required for sulfatase activity